MKEWIAAQGGDATALDDTSKLPQAKFSCDVLAEHDGYIAHMNTEDIGISASLLGAGRISKGDAIDLSAGIKLYKKTGDKVAKGEIIATLFASDESKFAAAKEKYIGALMFSKEKVEKPKLILKTIE